MIARNSSILRQAAFRLFLSLGLFVLLVGISTALIYRVALGKAAHERAEDLLGFYSARLMQLERDWEVGTRDVRVRIEYTRILEQPESAMQNLQAYLTIQGGGRRYAYMVIENRQKKVLFAFGKEHESIVAAVEQGKLDDGWFFEPRSRALYRIFEEQIWLGKEGTGRVLFFYRIDNALLLQMAMPGTQLTALYLNQQAASSEGQSGLTSMSGFSDSSASYESRILPWTGTETDPVKLDVRSPVKGLFSTTQLVGGASAIPLLDALILWFTLGTWLLFNARRIKALGDAVREFSSQQAMTSALGRHIDAARRHKGDEINEVATAIESMALQAEQRDRERLAEEAQRRLWAQVFEGSNDAIVITDAQHRVVAVNPAFEQSMGYSQAEIVGHDPHELMASGQHDESFYQGAWHQIDSLGYWQGEIWDRVKSGEILPKLLSISAIRNPSGVVTNYVGIYTDLTERKRSEAQREQYREQLEKLVRERTQELEKAQQELLKHEKLATLGQLTATVSHELRNPLAAMRPSLYVIRHKLPEGEEKVHKAIERIERNITRCDHIIDELMDFTRMRELSLVTQEFDPWVDGVLGEQPLPQGLQLRFEPGLGGCRLQIDPERLRRVLINVFDNACRALVEKQGESGPEYQPRLTVSSRRGTDGRIELAFADNGPGMSEEVMARIFEPLFSTRGFGVGLGMALVKQIMEQHGGGVDVSSQAGQGTQVILYWHPVSTDKEE